MVIPIRVDQALWEKISLILIFLYRKIFIHIITNNYNFKIVSKYFPLV